ncbi:DNA-binding domain-containing protein [Aliifodinibius sp. S!AR15-10]|uniref:DNA-binding domain-containing protein n=1 Tax=Aliifodinibius sp. S!AR15-10 TaxID=2950437 RepID=UPI0038F6C8EB
MLEEFEAAIAQILLRGGSINTPLFRINGSISGVFTGPADSFDPERHEVKLNVNPGIRVKNLAERISVEKVSPRAPNPSCSDTMTTAATLTTRR